MIRTCGCPSAGWWWFAGSPISTPRADNGQGTLFGTWRFHALFTTVPVEVMDTVTADGPGEVEVGMHRRSARSPLYLAVHVTRSPKVVVAVVGLPWRRIRSRRCFQLNPWTHFGHN